MKFSEETHDGNDEEESDSDSSYTEIPQMQMMTWRTMEWTVTSNDN